MAKSGKKHFFTLFEIVAVTAILALTASMSVAVLRKDSPARKIERAKLEFEAFCSRVRFRAMAAGEDGRIVFVTDKKMFCAGGYEEKDDPEMRWRLPEDFTLAEDMIQHFSAMEEGNPEIFRFFPDGGASGTRTFSIVYGKFTLTFDVSPLTGMLTATESDGTDTEILP